MESLLSVMRISLFCNDQMETVTDLLHDMSIHYNGDNASSREVVRANLITNILGPASGVTLVMATDATGRAVGVAAISLLYPAPKETGQLFMKELYVHSDSRGKGIGQKMMRWIAAYAVKHNCARFDWTVDTTNTKALEFYRELGAMPVSDKLYFRFGSEELIRFSDGDI